MAPWYLPKRIKNVYLHKILHTDVYSSFIYNCQNLEAINMSFNRQKDKLTEIYFILDKGILFSAKKN